MLTIRCATCKTKLWKYDKIGHGEVLRCHKARISKWYVDEELQGDKIVCPNCKRRSALIKAAFIKWIRMRFYTMAPSATNRTMAFVCSIQYNDGMKAWRRKKWRKFIS